MPIPGEQFNNPASRTLDFVHGLRSRSAVSRSPLAGGTGIGNGAASLSRSTFQKYSHWNNRLGVQRSPLAFSKRMRSLRLPRLNLAHVMRFRRPYSEPASDYFSDDLATQPSFETSSSYFNDEPAHQAAADYPVEAAQAAAQETPHSAVRSSSIFAPAVKRSVKPVLSLPVFGSRMVARRANPSVGAASARTQSFAAVIAHAPEVRMSQSVVAPLAASKSIANQASRVVASRTSLLQIVQRRIAGAAPQASARAADFVFGSAPPAASPVSVERPIGASVQRISPREAPEISMDLSLPPSAMPSRVMPADSAPNPERTVSDMRESAARSVEPRAVTPEVPRQQIEPTRSAAITPASPAIGAAPASPGVQLTPGAPPPRMALAATAAKQIARMVNRSEAPATTMRRQQVEGVARGAAFRKSLPIASAAPTASAASPKVQRFEAGSLLSQPVLSPGPVEPGIIPSRLSAAATSMEIPSIRRMESPPNTPSQTLAGARGEAAAPSVRETRSSGFEPESTEHVRRTTGPDVISEPSARRDVTMRQAEVQRSELPKQEMQVPDLEMAHPVAAEAAAPDTSPVSSPAIPPDAPPMVRRTALPAQPSIGPLAKGKAAIRTASVQRLTPVMPARSISSDVVQRWSGQTPAGAAASQAGPGAPEQNMTFAGRSISEPTPGSAGQVQRYLGEAGPPALRGLRSAAPKISTPDSITGPMLLNRVSSVTHRVSRDSAESEAHPLHDRAPEKLLPAPTVSTGPRGVNGGSWVQRAPDGPAAGAPAPAAQGQQQAAAAQQGLGSSAQTGSAGGSSDDAKDMAHQVWNILKRRLQVEAERHGKH